MLGYLSLLLKLIHKALTIIHVYLFSAKLATSHNLLTIKKKLNSSTRQGFSLFHKAHLSL